MLIAVVALVMAALVLLQRYVYKTRWNRNIRLDLTFSDKLAVEGDTLTLTEVITNRKLLPLPWLAVKFQLSRNLRFADMENAKISDDFYRSDMFNLLPYRRITRKLPFVCGKRGFYTIKSADLVSGDLFNSVRLTMSAPCGVNLTVYPRLIDCDNILHAHRQFLGQILTKRFIQPDPFEFKGIREYQPYDSLRSINFKATAKTGVWMVNVNDYTVTQQVILLLNLGWYSPYPDEFLYEQTIRLAASLAVYYVENGIPLGFAMNAASSGIVRVESGASRSHADSIRELLAYVDVSVNPDVRFTELLAEERRLYDARRRTGSQPAYILLSTDHSPDIADGYAALAECGADTLWIVPASRGMEIKMELTDRVVRADL
jgi:uncharacterized protein (DUF58 family)